MLRETTITKITENVAQDPWFKLARFLQQHWAILIEESDAVLVVFFDDCCGIFDTMAFGSRGAAEAALRRNGFFRYRDDLSVTDFLRRPDGEFHLQEHPIGPIYSSGHSWC